MSLAEARLEGRGTVSPARAWVLAARPATLTAAVVPVAVGTACALLDGHARLGPALAALFGSMLIQIGTNFANDVFDYEKGADTDERLGPVRAVHAGLLTAAQVRRGMWITFALAMACGVYLTVVAGPAVVAIGLASILSGIAYTGGPYPLGYNGLGDLFVMIFFGFVAVGGTAFVQAGHVPAVAWIAAIPVGALATAILVVNNIRDRATDVRAGKRTLAVRLGRSAVYAEYLALLGAAYLVPVLLWRLRMAGPLAMLPLLTLPVAVQLARAVAVEEGRILNTRLAGTARLLMVHGLLLAAGLALSAR